MTSTILLTPGEPAGIGPDITLDALDQDWSCHLVVLADISLMESRARRRGRELELVEIDDISSVGDIDQPGKFIHHVPLEKDVVPGRLDADNSGYVTDCLSIAERYCREHGFTLVTGPVHKGIINDAGIAFTGHTEFLAAPSNSSPVMMLAVDDFRVVLVTTHMPLSEVSSSITQDKVANVIRTTDSFLRRHAGIGSPDLCVCGLNPHAGEGGHLGREEIDIILPAIETCRKEGITTTDPIPADTAFSESRINKHDAFITMFHDQGLPVLKHRGFGRAVNITMGLPFVRTSVDHGTALDIAASGGADPGSLIKALETAIEYLD